MLLYNTSVINLRDLTKNFQGKYKNFKHFLRAVKAVVVAGFPARKLIVVGVTGTNGKTTTTYLIHHILKTYGQKPVRISSLGIFYPLRNKTIPTQYATTTPLASEIQNIFRKMVNDSLKYAIIECSSLGLDQHRLLGCNIHVGVVTNITHDHLDYHRTFERYLRAKAKLVCIAKSAVLNADDNNYLYLKKVAGKKALSYSMTRPADIYPDILPFKLSSTSIYNQYNILAAISTARILNIPFPVIKKAISSFKYPEGHLQEVKLPADFKVFIDFAHTPNGLRNLLDYIKKTSPVSRIILVFGCEGQRDTQKRPIMGEIADKGADVIILTASDPRNEILDIINAQILSGVTRHTPSKDILIIPNRQQAITTALSEAKKGDVVLVVGKGHEKTLQIGKEKIPWSEEKAIKKAFKTIPSKLF